MHDILKEQSLNCAREILVIEDNPADVRLIREAVKLLDSPVQVHAVSDGDSALKFLRREEPFGKAPKPALIFLDFNLPKTNSREVLRTIKSDQELRNIAVAILTSSLSDQDMRDAYELQANCYLTKPQDLHEFFYTIGCAARFWLNSA